MKFHVHTFFSNRNKLGKLETGLKAGCRIIIIITVASFAVATVSNYRILVNVFQLACGSVLRSPELSGSGLGTGRAHARLQQRDGFSF